MKNRRPKGLFPAKGEIKRLRDERGWLQKELADKALLDTRTVQRAESGRARIGRGHLQSIAAQFDLSVADIVIETDAVSEPRKRYHESVRASATLSADEIFKLFSKVTEVEYRLEADPNRAQAENIARALEIMGTLKECATYREWRDPGEEPLPFPNQIRMRGELNDLLKELAANKIRIFIGQYVLRSNLPDFREGEDGRTVKLLEPTTTAKGVVVVATEETRAFSRQFFGMSEEEQIAELRAHLNRGQFVSSWPWCLQKFRREYEAEVGREIPTWSEQHPEEEVPF